MNKIVFSSFISLATFACSNGSSGSAVNKPESLDPKVQKSFVQGETLTFDVHSKNCLNNEMLEITLEMGSTPSPGFEIETLSGGECINNVRIHVENSLKSANYHVDVIVTNVETEKKLEMIGFDFKVVGEDRTPGDPAPKESDLWSGEAELTDAESGTCNGRPCEAQVKEFITDVISNFKGRAHMLNEQLKKNTNVEFVFKPFALKDPTAGEFEMTCANEGYRPLKGEYSIRKGHFALRLKDDLTRTCYLKIYPDTGLHGQIPFSPLEKTCAVGSGYLTY